MLHLLPLYMESSSVAKELSPPSILDDHLDAETLLLIVIPLADLGATTKEQRESEANWSLIEALFSRTELQASVWRDLDVNVDGKVLMRPEIIDNGVALLAVNHVSVETSSQSNFKSVQPRNRFTSEAVPICVVLDGERDLFSLFGEHNGAPGSD